MPEEAPDSGIYTASMIAALPGVYHFRVLAGGKTLRGRTFTREQLLTGAVWSGGDNPPPNSNDDPGVHKQDLCKLLSCILNGKVIQPEFERKLKEVGIDLNALRDCFKSWCRPAQPPIVTRPNLTAIPARGNPGRDGRRRSKGTHCGSGRLHRSACERTRQMAVGRA